MWVRKKSETQSVVLIGDPFKDGGVERNTLYGVKLFTMEEEKAVDLAVISPPEQQRLKQLFADFSDAVLAGQLGKKGARFVTWEWDWDYKGVHHGHYFQNGCEEAKHDFVRCSGLLPKEALFEPEQLDEIHRALAFVCEQDEGLSIGREKEIKTIMEQIKCLLPESPEQTRTMEQSM